MEIFGKSPVAWPELILGKIALIICVFFFLLRTWIPGPMLFESAATQALGIALYAVGLILLFVAIAHLGRSTAVGLPDGATNLKTQGLYRFSRNPIYVCGYLACTGSVLMSLHPVNILCLLITMAVHHHIILREEVFLQNRFGEEWGEYRQKVRRYI